MAKSRRPGCPFAAREYDKGYQDALHDYSEYIEGVPDWPFEDVAAKKPTSRPFGERVFDPEKGVWVPVKPAFTYNDPPGDPNWSMEKDSL